jgi:catechol 2,3-dioxygenase-like lactoylglutathione lyase family enzyme
VTGQAQAAGLLHHVELYVADLRRAERFWGWFLGRLGYVEFQRWDSGVSYRFGTTYLVFVQAQRRFLDLPFHRCRPGLNHLAFHASSRQQVDDLTEELKARGVQILYRDRHPFAGGGQHYAVFFEDPDRLKVEVVAPD